jgi:signal transduction histidine kinase
VSVALSRNHDQSVVFSVKDNGVGMTSEEVETVGTPFLKFEKQPLHNEMNANGLGLALTLQLIQVHDGELLILSAPGEGTEAKVIFPQTRVLG